MTYAARFIAVPFIFFLAACSAPKKYADTVLVNGNIITLETDQPNAEALAILGDTIFAVGKTSDIKKLVDASTKVIDLQGKTAIPGFVEGHAHFTGLGYAQMTLRLGAVKTWDEVAAMVKAAAETAPAGAWIIGRGWHQEKWDKLPEQTVDGYPTHDPISAVSPNNPVLLRHASGHLLFANAKAMELARVGKETPSPAGGTIWRDKKGDAIGIFQETAQELIGAAYQAAQSKRTPAEIDSTERKAIELATAACLQNGITSFQDAGSSFETIERLKKLVDEKKLGMRVWMMASAREPNLEKNLSKYKLVNYGDKRFTVRAVKEYMDGALGSHGAWLLKPYSDLPSTVGQNVRAVEEIAATAKLAAANGFQLCTHAIGDRANREVLNIYESVFKEIPDNKNLRWRVEHAQHLSEDDIPRFAKLGVIASMQGIHCTSDAPYVVKRLSEMRAKEGGYVWQKLWKSGAVVSNGTDAPVEDVSAIACYYASVTRKLKDGSVFYDDQKLSRLEALKSYTLNPAYAAFEERDKGSLKVGKLADIAVLSKDILTIPDDEILSTEILYTIVGGKMAYEKSTK